MDRKTVSDETNNKTICKIQFFGREIIDSSVGQLRRESHCPGVALSEHEAKLHFIALRATDAVGDLKTVEGKTN